MPPFSCAGKIIVPINDYEIKENVKTFYVKKLFTKSRWYKNPGKGKIYQDSTLDLLKGVEK